MREWIAYIIFMNPRLNALCAKIEKRIQNTALDMDKPAHKGTAEIDALNQLKARLVNLRVMYDALKKRLGEDGLALFDEKYEPQNISRSTLYRRRVRAAGKAALTLAALGFDRQRLESEYSGLACFDKAIPSVGQ